jgi:hypothetical protein
LDTKNPTQGIAAKIAKMSGYLPHKEDKIFHAASLVRLQHNAAEASEGSYAVSQLLVSKLWLQSDAARTHQYVSHFMREDGGKLLILGLELLCNLNVPDTVTNLNPACFIVEGGEFECYARQCDAVPRRD